MVALEAELVGDRIRVNAHPRFTTIALRAFKEVRGGHWFPSKQQWRYPLDWRTCLEIRAAAESIGWELEIGDELWEWAENEKVRQEAIPDPKDMHLVDLPRVRQSNPYLWEALKSRPFQTVGTAFIARNRHVVLADEMGLGKTVQTIAAVIEADVKGCVLVVAPKTACTLTWAPLLEEWAPDEPVTVLASVNKPERELRLKAFYTLTEPNVFRTKRHWLLVNPYWVSATAELDKKGNYKYPKAKRDEGIGMQFKMPELFDIEWGAIIVDESHQSLVIPSMNRKKWTQVRTGLDNLWQDGDELRIALSGTPARGKKEQFFGTLNWLRPQHYQGYWPWVKHNFEVEESEGWFDKGALKPIGIKDTKKFYEELSEVMIRRTKAEVAKDLPPIIYGGTHLNKDHKGPIGIWLPIEGKQLQQYSAMERDGALWTAGGSVMANGILAEWTRLKQLATWECTVQNGSLVPARESNKMEWILQFLDERGISKTNPEGNGKVIIASQFATVCKAVEARLANEGIPSFLLTGETKPNDRLAMQNAFQRVKDEESTRVFILSTKAGGVSITLDAADDVIIMDETWIPDDQQQVEARAHRVSRIHQCSVWYLRSLGTIEEAIAAVTHERSESISDIMDGARGHKVLRLIKEYKRAG